MCLPTPQVDQFYKIWRPLLHFANEELQIVPNLTGKGLNNSIDVALAVKVRDALWEHETVLEKFIAKNPAQLSPQDLLIAENWKHRYQGRFVIFKVLKKHAIFISQDKHADVFTVKGLYNPFEGILGGSIPALVKTVLLPFGNEIISDGLFQSYNLIFGSGIRGELKAIYDDAREREAIITTLLPDQSFQTRENLIGKAETINAKVIEAFARHLYKTGRSPKTVERDVMTIGRFASALLVKEPISLRVFILEDLQEYMKQLPAIEQKSANLCLKRFIEFSQETGRLDWNEAENMLEILRLSR